MKIEPRQTSIQASCDIRPHRGEGFAGNDPFANGSLDRNFKQLSRDDLVYVYLVSGSLTDHVKRRTKLFDPGPPHLLFSGTMNYQSEAKMQQAVRSIIDHREKFMYKNSTAMASTWRQSGTAEIVTSTIG